MPSRRAPGARPWWPTSTGGPSTSARSAAVVADLDRRAVDERQERGRGGRPRPAGRRRAPGARPWWPTSTGGPSTSARSAAVVADLDRRAVDERQERGRGGRPRPAGRRRAPGARPWWPTSTGGPSTSARSAAVVADLDRRAVDERQERGRGGRPRPAGRRRAPGARPWWPTSTGGPSTSARSAAVVADLDRRAVDERQERGRGGRPRPAGRRRAPGARPWWPTSTGGPSTSARSAAVVADL